MEMDGQNGQRVSNAKARIGQMGERYLPDYKKELVLKTDASNVGLGAVLLQEVNGIMRPIQWASKKLTPAESRHGISEKEMLGIYWGIKKFEYELRGKKFRLITDHKALEQIRQKPNFENNRINRWIEKIQEFDFSIEYQKPENLVGPDALSRIYEEPERNTKKEKHAAKILEGKCNKHVFEENNKQYWVYDSGLKVEMPRIEDRLNIVKEAHKKTNHRSVEATYQELKATYYWVGMKKTVENVLKNCEVCNKVNYKKKGGVEFVETTRPLEKVALDLLDLRSDGVYALVGIDYYTRYAFVQLTDKKDSMSILNILKKWCEHSKPEEIITDNGKEFTNKDFKEFCNNENIAHRTISIEAHRSNGRVERVIRTIREGLLKSDKQDITEKVNNTIGKYNTTYHSAIKMTPTQAIKTGGTEILAYNSRYGEYVARFRKSPREQFYIGQMVKIAKNENLGTLAKNTRGRFTEEGIIKGKFGKDSYLVMKSDGKMTKKRHYDLKRLVGESGRLTSRGGML